jgi:hypothetical protein
MLHEELDRGDANRVSTGDTTAARQDALRGEVIFASVEEQSPRCTELLGAGALLVMLPPPMKDARGRLGEILEELVERELARMGAPSPYLAAWSAMPEDAQARLADQLFRARTVGATGLAIAIGSLRALATPVLGPDDSATLRWLAEATETAPLVLVLDDADLMLHGYAAPLPLGSLLATRTPLWEMAEHEGSTPSPAPLVEERDDAESGPSVHPTVTSVKGTMETLGSDHLVDDLEDADAPVVFTGEDATMNDMRVLSIDAVPSIDAGQAILQGERESEPAPATEVDPELVQAEAREIPQVIVETLTATPKEPPAPEPTNDAPKTADRAEASATSKPERTAEPIEAREEPRVPERAEARPRRAQLQSRNATRRVSAGVPVSGPNDAWRSWAIALAAARGPQPLAAFERLFAESYVPLANAIASGLDDPRAVRAYDDFRRSFERSYTDAFATFGATNRRPRLVMDAYDIAAKQARLSNARSAHVLLVDSMRFDLGCLIRDALAREATGVAALMSEVLLWSALPTTTTRQIETLARGLDALRAPAREEPSESLRGRAAEVVRRVRVGSRELYKLDLVPALIEGTTDVVASLEGIATAAAEAIARHISTLPPRTLLFIAGDHGFTVDRRGDVKIGGASPEEVLVPAFAWLVGDLH